MIIVLGVSGSGKTTIGQGLAKQLGLPFYDADDFHPLSNINKMKNAIPLGDEDRMPWLTLLSDKIKEWDDLGCAVLSCSALKESYRKLLASKTNNVTWVYLKGTFELIQSRLNQREGHYMKSALLQSQFDTLEEPDYGIHVNIEDTPEHIISGIVSRLKPISNSEFGLIGLGVMGKSLSLNIAEKGFKISVYNRSEGIEAHVVPEFLKEHENFNTISGFTDLKELVSSLEQPRKLLMMVKAGAVVDSVIEQLLPLLSPGDIVIDGGNSHFTDTQRRFEQLRKHSIHFIGCGISGGEEGARKGPSMMPGGTLDSYQKVSPILEAIAAKDSQGKPCCTYIGANGSGHFIKMVHNGMEYAEMQLLAELYGLMSNAMSNDEMANLFINWNNTDLSSYLLEITVDILRKKENGHYLLDHILDKAENKGTGSWSSKTALDMGVPSTMMASAVFARYLSSLKDKRTQLSKQLQHVKGTKSDLDVKSLEHAYRFTRIVNHHQGFELMQQASKTYNWNLNLPEIARIWTNGCIIRSQFMQDCISYLKESDGLISHQRLFKILEASEGSMKAMITSAMVNRVPMDTFWASYNYWVSMTTEQLPANLIQAQRDYFGAHTYQRNDKSSSAYFHTNWNES